MKDRVVTVPRDKAAEEALYYDEAEPHQLIDFHIAEEDFYKLYLQGVFQVINEAGSALIDDCEEDKVTGRNNISNVIRALGVLESSQDDELKYLIKRVKNLFEDALNRDTGVYFFF